MDLAQKLFYRLTEVEKIKLRAATAGTIEYLSATDYLSDLPDMDHDKRAAVVTDVRSLCDFEFKVKSDTMNFDQVTWKF